MTIKIEFPSGDKVTALAFGQALTAIGKGGEGATKARPEWTVEAVEAAIKDIMMRDLDYQAAPDHIEYGDPGAFAELDGEQVNTETGEITQAPGKPAGTATGPGTSTASQTSAPAAANGRVDEKGVPFDAAFCANAAKPFYGSGKTKGQWKKRQGVEPEWYDEWYERALAMAQVDASEEDEAADLQGGRDYAAEQRAACAFSNTPQKTQTTGPQDMGALMAWISEEQTAGRLPADAVQTAFVKLELPMDALLNPAGDIPGNCAKVWQELGGGA